MPQTGSTAQKLMTPQDMKERITPEVLETSCRKYRQELIMQPIETMKDNTLKYITLVPGVRNTLTFGELKGDAQLAPWNRNNVKDADYKIEGRTLQVWPGNCAYDFDPMEIFQSIYGNSIMLGKQLSESAVARQVVTLFAASIGKHLNDHVFDAVRNVAGTTTKDLFDGFDTILGKEKTAETLSAANGNYMAFTGTMDKTTTVDGLKEFYRKANKHLRNRECFMYLPEKVYWDYIDDYQARHGSLPYNTDYEKLTLEGSNGKCRFAVMNNMADSNFLKISVKQNFLLGTDINSQENRVSVKEYREWVYTMLFAAVYGAQVRSLSKEVLFVAELAESNDDNGSNDNGSNDGNGSDDGNGEG